MSAAKPEVAPVPAIVARPEHNVSRANVSRAALRVLYGLKEGGYKAFLVGGGVRDLLLGQQPKDFDIATDAHPEEVAKLFRNCRLIGRRFRLAHVRFGREIIEVATFRAAGVDDDGADLRVQDEGGRILRDNVYGRIDEDVWRRDFTANALYYNIADFSIWDFVGGVEDVRRRLLRLIGDPETRYREDPVRMLRAVRFAAKLDFSIESATAAPIRQLAPLLTDVPPARLFEEVIKLFHSGRAAGAFDALREYGLFGELFPQAERAFAGPDGERLVQLTRLALDSTDRRIAEDLPVTPMFVFAVLLWGPVRERATRIREVDGGSESQALSEAAAQVAFEQQSTVAIPRRYSTPMREMLAMQPRLEQRSARRATRLMAHKRFRAAYDFLMLRAECGDADPELAAWWTRMQDGEGTGRTQSSDDAADAADSPDAADAPRKKRRRRRRRRGGGGDDGAQS